MRLEINSGELKIILLALDNLLSNIQAGSEEADWNKTYKLFLKVERIE